MEESAEPVQICVIGPDRAGTTHFCSLFEGVENVHTSGESILYEVLKYKGDEPFEKKKALIQEFVDQARASGKEFALYKIIHHQMTPEELGAFFLPDDRMIKIVITRNILDMYISHRKAKKVKSWKNTDTSGIRVWFDYKFKFDWWTRQRVDHLKQLKRELDDGGYRPLLVDYADLHGLEDDLAKLKWVAGRIREEYGVRLEVPETVEPEIRRQDTATSYRKKVYNYGSLKRKVKGRDLELRRIFEGLPFKF